MFGRGKIWLRRGNEQPQTEQNTSNPSPPPPTPDDKLDDLLRDGLRIVFCGTAAGRKSAATRSYYAGPGNRFWEVLHQVGLTDRRLQPSEFRQLRDYHIGLTDLAKKASGMDRDLNPGDFDRQRLEENIREFKPKILAFTSKKAAQTFFEVRKVGFGFHSTIGETAIWVMPSTSALAKSSWNLSWWHRLPEQSKSM